MRWLLALFAAFPLLAHGAQITVDFNSGSHGFQFRSECHDGPGWDWSFPNPDSDQTFAMSHFCPHGGTVEQMAQWGYPDIGREYLPQLVITRVDNRPFTLHGFDHYSFYEVAVRSSRGGFFGADPTTYCNSPDYDAPDCQWDVRTELDHPLFRNVQWITLCPGCGDFGEGSEGHHQIGIFDNFSLSYAVNEPPPLWLLLTMAPVALLINRQHRKVMKRQRGQP